MSKTSKIPELNARQTLLVRQMRSFLFATKNSKNEEYAKNCMSILLGVFYLLYPSIDLEKDKAIQAFEVWDEQNLGLNDADIAQLAAKLRLNR